MKHTKLIVKTRSKNYPIYFGNNFLNMTGKLIEKNLPEVKKICIINDNKIPKKILKKLINSLKKYEIKICKISVNEKIKSFNVAKKIIEKLLKDNFNRTDCIIALGGGVIGDLSAFIANLTKRGIKFINIPSTLLAQVDASVGGKTGINSVQGKNLIGTFYQPDFIISDTILLKSLPHRQIISGYGEILKHALIAEKEFFMWLYKNGNKVVYEKNSIFLKKAVIKSCKIKSKIINKDEKEENWRMVLNFGHTFAHGFEGATNFSKRLTHGEAVLLGMMVASDLSFKKNRLTLKELSLLKQHYQNLNLPKSINKKFKIKEVKKIISFMKKDKKNIDKKLNLILLSRIGKTTKPKEFFIKTKEIERFLNNYFK